MSTGIFPPMGVTGSFTLKEPFTVDLNLNYTVRAIRSFADLQRAKLDPVTLVYAPVGLTDVDYNIDLRTLARIYTLTSVDGDDTVHVPSSYILSYPRPNENTHQWFHAVVSLGILPNNFELTRIKEAIGTEVSKYVGVDCEVNIATSEVLEQITDEQAILLEEARIAAIAYGSTLYKDKLELELKLEAAYAQINDLIGIVQDQTHTAP